MKRETFYELVDGYGAFASGCQNEVPPERYNKKPSLASFICTETSFNFAAPRSSGYICPEYEGRTMIIVPLAEAKNNLSKLVDDAAAGQVITIAKHGRPLARLVPVERPRGQRIGAMKGKLVVTDDFDAALPDDLLDAFEGQKT